MRGVRWPSAGQARSTIASLRPKPRRSRTEIDHLEPSRGVSALPMSPLRRSTPIGPIAAAPRSPALERLSALQAETFAGIEERMLGRTGLPVDRIRLDGSQQVVERSAATSPSNVALYLAAIIAERDRGRLDDAGAAARAKQVLAALEALPKDPRGFLFNWYDADDGRMVPQAGRGLDARGMLQSTSGAGYVSSVDNGNLIIALLGLRAAMPDPPQIAASIDRLLAPMRSAFAAAFLTSTPNTAGSGAIRLGYFAAPQGDLRAESHYDRLGSEARATVAALEALGALPAGTLAQMAARASFTEPSGSGARLLRTWDGGVFQYLLPEVLLGEASLSKAFAAHHRALAELLLAGQDGLPLAYSASDRPSGGYDGKSGLVFLAEDAGEVHQEVLTPHAVFLLASIDPVGAGRALARLEAKFPAARRPGIGFVDAIDPRTGAAGDTVLALDQLMSVVAGADFGRYVARSVPALSSLYRSVSLADPIPREAREEVRAVARTTLEPEPFRSTVAQSEAILSRRLELRGHFDRPQITASGDGAALTFTPPAGAGVMLDGVRYLELPNSTALTTVDPITGRTREWVLTRGVRPYTNTIRPEDQVFNAPQGYVSDVLLFERVGSGKDAHLEYRRPLLRSRPELGFLFEDPRISTLDLDTGRKILLSGTDYSPHLPGSSAPDVMNRFVELELDPRGMPLPIAVDGETGRPAFRDLSPPPVDAGPKGGWRFVDAKNGTVAQNARGEIVVRSRMRPDFAQLPPELQRWDYAEQVFVFSSWDQLTRYDWRHALDDLFGLADGAERVRPLRARVVATEASFADLYPPESWPSKPKLGFGPGTAPIQLRRRGQELLVSEGPGAPERRAGTIPAGSAFPLADGETKFVTFDHDLRLLEDRRFGEAAKKRVYTGTVKLWNDGLDALELVYAQAMQPVVEHTIRGSGIIDLHHTYPMGRVLAEHPDDPSRTIARVYSGAADAHTESLEIDLVRLLVEMAPGSPRRASGQVAPPLSGAG